MLKSRKISSQKSAATKRLIAQNSDPVKWVKKTHESMGATQSSSRGVGKLTCSSFSTVPACEPKSSDNTSYTSRVTGFIRSDEIRVCSSVPGAR